VVLGSWLGLTTNGWSSILGENSQKKGLPKVWISALTRFRNFELGTEFIHRLSLFPKGRDNKAELSLIVTNPHRIFGAKFSPFLDKNF